MTKELFEKFKSSWLEEIKKIENRAIDSRGVYMIFIYFHRDRLFHEMNLKGETESEISLDLDNLESKLRVALETARCRYNLENRGVWARIAEGIGGIIYRVPKEIKS